VPHANQLEFFGDDDAEHLYRASAGALEEMGGRKVEIDFAVFRKAADLLYAGPWVAERMAAIQEFMETNRDQMNPVVREIISGAARYSAIDAFQAEYQLRELRRAAETEWARMDFLFLPTTGTIYTHQQIEADPIKLNTNLGYYTNFVNLLDLAAVAVPAGMRPNGLPFGVSMIGPAFSDEALLSIAAAFHRHCSDGAQPLLELGTPPGCVELAVVGAHLSGQPLDKELTDRGARLLRTMSTAEGYRLYALDGRIPKPGLVREESFQGPGIEVEVWAMPEDRLGGFVNSIPAPLGIGTVRLSSGQAVKCFLCEPHAVAGARDITHFGGWRNYLSSVNSRDASAEPR
jgi:allophanate hydrolase